MTTVHAEATDTEVQLLELMSDVSEEQYCAGWLMGLERDLYRRVFCGDAPDYGWGPIAPDTLKKLRDLAEACGKWWSWSDLHDETGETLISLAEAERRWGKP